MPKGVYDRQSPPNYADRACIRCGAMFKPLGSQQRYCNPCRGETKKEQSRRATQRQRDAGYGYDSCSECGARKQATSARCSPCARKYHRMERHPRWKGGKTIARGGYIRVRTGDGGYDWEHRVVWEQAHGRRLPKGHIIHHLNGIRSDNRPENLASVKRHEHEYQTLLKLAQQRIRELEQLRFNI